MNDVAPTLNAFSTEAVSSWPVTTMIGVVKCIMRARRVSS